MGCRFFVSPVIKGRGGAPSLAERSRHCRPTVELGIEAVLRNNGSGAVRGHLERLGAASAIGRPVGYHVVRYGLLGAIGQFSSAEALRYPRSSRVVVRSQRGLEVGQVLAEPGDRCDAASPEGQILRRMTVEDDLLQARLESRRGEALAACEQLLAEQGIAAALLDVEHLFDGEGLYFYFLGEPPSEAVRLTEALAERYEAAVQFRTFADTLSEGCGPGCGTEEAAGQGGCSNCTSCAVASACGVKSS